MWRIFAREQVRAEAALAVAGGQDDVAQVRLERRRARPWRSRPPRSAGAGARRPRGRVGRRPRRRRARRRSARRCRAAARSAVSVWNRPTGRPLDADQRLARRRRGRAGRPSSRPATDVSRSASGANSRAMSVNRPSPMQVDPFERVPGVLAQLGLGEPRGLELAESRSRSIASSGGQVRSAPPNSASHRSRDREPGGAGRPRSGRASGRRGGARRSRSRRIGFRREELGQERRRWRRRSRTWSKSYAGAASEAAPDRPRRYHRAMPTQTWVEPVVLEGTRVRLEPLAPRPPGRPRARRLRSRRSGAGRSWAPQDEAGLARWVETALANAGGRHGAAVRHDRPRQRAGRSGAAASCRSCPSTAGSRSAGRGSASAYQRTGANREAKLLQLTHAFETLGANRVEFKTARPERAVAQRAGGHRRHLRGRLPQAT